MARQDIGPIPGMEKYAQPNPQAAYKSAYIHMEQGLLKAWEFKEKLSNEQRQSIADMAIIYAHARTEPYTTYQPRTPLSSEDQMRVHVLSHLVPDQQKEATKELTTGLLNQAELMIAERNWNRIQVRNRYSSNAADILFGNHPTARYLRIAADTGVMMAKHDNTPAEHTGVDIGRLVIPLYFDDFKESSRDSEHRDFAVQLLDAVFQHRPPQRGRTIDMSLASYVHQTGLFEAGFLFHWLGGARVNSLRLQNDPSLYLHGVAIFTTGYEEFKDEYNDSMGKWRDTEKREQTGTHTF
jgi:hypothetical protein